MKKLEESDRTPAERLFEQYLEAHKLTDFEFEPMLEHTRKRPDYRVTLETSTVFFEVKEFVPQAKAAPGGSFDPYGPIREKIDQAREKFRSLKGHMCVLVLGNPQGGLVLLDPSCVYGAMLGNLGIEVPFDPAAGCFYGARASSTFLSGGRMVRYGKNGRVMDFQNTTVSAICILDTLAERSRRILIEIAKRELEIRSKLSEEEIVRLIEGSRGVDTDSSFDHLRVVVCENPYARTPLTEAFGKGPFDERFGAIGGCLRRVFAGSTLRTLEAEERAAGIQSRRPFKSGEE